jgi:hypothetical protein
MGQHIVNGSNAHFDTGITFPQQFNGILFYHNNTPSDSVMSVWQNKPAVIQAK